jgi:hypothetical protein
VCTPVNNTQQYSSCVVLYGDYCRVVLYRYGLLEDFEMVRKYGFLYRGYEEDYCFWELVVAMRKVLLVLVRARH